jgi:hypothetical protein
MMIMMLMMMMMMMRRRRVYNTRKIRKASSKESIFEIRNELSFFYLPRCGGGSGSACMVWGALSPVPRQRHRSSCDTLVTLL